MSRNDASLYTGVSSASFKTVRTHRVAEAEKKLETQNKLTPAAEVVAEVIAQERIKVTAELANLPITAQWTDEYTLAKVMSFKEKLTFITDFEIKMQNALRKANR